MAAGDGGVIINVSSVAASHPTADVLPYAAAVDPHTIGLGDVGRPEGFSSGRCRDGWASSTATAN